MASVAPALAEARAGLLFYYSPYNFLRAVPAEAQQRLLGVGRALAYGQQAHELVFAHGSVQFLYYFLPWDTAFFQEPMYRLFTALFGPETSAEELTAAARAFQQELKRRGVHYIHADLPAEDTALIQALGRAGWALIETRLHYYKDDLAAFDWPRYPVRAAEPAEAERLGRLAAATRNDYDRFHADPWFGPARADAFLHRYATAAVGGYCAAVLVPAEAGQPSEAFVAITDPLPQMAEMGFRASRATVGAVGAANRGWHLKLLAETVHRARAAGHDYVLFTTQAANRAGVRTHEKLGLRLGACSHVLSYAPAS